MRCLPPSARRCRVVVRRFAVLLCAGALSLPGDAAFAITEAQCLAAHDCVNRVPDRDPQRPGFKDNVDAEGYLYGPCAWHKWGGCFNAGFYAAGPDIGGVLEEYEANIEANSPCGCDIRFERTEDWLTDFVHHRPRLLRRLEGDRRASFFRKYQDTAPHQVLVEGERSLCLIRPDQVWGRFTLDPYSRKYEARLAFSLGDQAFLGSTSKGGLPVTDLKWRALGRVWLAEANRLDFDSQSLCEKLGADEVYLTVGLSRTYEGQTWLLVLAVHTVPDFDSAIDYAKT